MNLNEAPSELPEAIKAGIAERLLRADWRRYPDNEMSRCRELIGAWYGLDERWVLFGNGSNELLAAALLACSRAKGRIFWLTPGFSMVPQMAAWFDRTLVTESLDPFDFSFPTFCGSTSLHGVDAVLLASPNNPTGTVLPLEIFNNLIARFSGPVILDEAYGEFAEQSFVPALGRCEDLIVLRTFSKALSLAGGRIGYALAHPDWIRRLEAYRAPFSVGLFQQLCIETLAGSKGCLDEAVAKTKKERKALSEAIGALPGFRVIDSQANFLLFSPGARRAERLWQGLKQEGIWLRRFEEPVLTDWLRVGVGSPEENRLLVGALKDFAAGGLA